MSEFVDRKFIFIQTPDDMDGEEQDEIVRHLNGIGKQMEPTSYIFVMCNPGYKAMDADEINKVLNHLLEAATA